MITQKGPIVQSTKGRGNSRHFGGSENKKEVFSKVTPRLGGKWRNVRRGKKTRRKNPKPKQTPTRKNGKDPQKAQKTTSVQTRKGKEAGEGETQGRNKVPTVQKIRRKKRGLGTEEALGPGRSKVIEKKKGSLTWLVRKKWKLEKKVY